jgi:hypothetical protein
MNIDPDVFVKSLSAFASTLSIAASYRKLTGSEGTNKSDEETKNVIEELKKYATPYELIALSDPAIVSAAIEITIISGPLLGQISKEAQACERRYIAERRKAKTNRDYDLASRKAAECMCRTLRTIKSHNGNDLPGGDTDPLKSWWKAYECQD